MPIPFVTIGIMMAITAASMAAQYFLAKSKKEKIKPAEMEMQTSQYGIPIPVVFGRCEPLPGNLIWYGNFQTHKKKQKGGKGGSSSNTTYEYSVSLAFGLCLRDGQDVRLVNGFVEKETLDPSSYTFYDGTQTTPDPHIQSIMESEGKTRFPVWKDLCYVVLDNYYLEGSTFIPQFTWELERGPSASPAYVRAVTGTGGSAGATTDDDYFYLASGTSHCVKIYQKSDWSLVDTVGSIGSGDGQFDGPTDIDIDDNYIYVADNNNSRVQILDKSTHEYVGQFGSEGVNSGEFHGIGGIVVDDNYIYTLEASTYFSVDRARVQVFNKSTYAFVAEFGEYGVNDDQFDTPTGIDVDNNYIYIIDTLKYCVMIFDKSTYAYITQFGSQGSEDGEFGNYPYGIHLHGRYIYTVESATDKIQIFDKNTYEFVAKWSHLGLMSNAKGIAADGDGIYICNTGGSNVLVLSQYQESKDVTPPEIVRDILTNNFYGTGLDAGRINSVVEDTIQYCYDKDLLVAMAFTTQSSVLDTLSYIMMHHNGFITYRDGEIYIKQIEMESTETQQSASNTITEADLCKKEGELPIRVERKGGREYKNKILIEFLDRKEEEDDAENRYTLALAQAEDPVDIDNYGLKEETIKLEGFKESSRALHMAWIYLRQILFNPRTFEFNLGIKSWGLSPGDVIYINSDVGLIDQAVRIMELRENEGVIRVTAVEEVASLYVDPPQISHETLPPPSPRLRGDPGDAIRPMIVEVPARYSPVYMLAMAVYSPSGEDAWLGASLYRSYSEGGTYNYTESIENEGVTGTVTGVGYIDDIAYIDIELDSDETIESIADGEYFQSETKNLAVIRTPDGRDIFIRYQTVELLSANNWRLTNVIYDTTGFPEWNSYGEIEAGGTSPYEIAMYELAPYTFDLITYDIGKTLYMKAASYNHVGSEQDLADIDPFSREIEGLNTKPLSPFGIEVNDVSPDGNNSITTNSGDIEIVWKSRNRFNTGGLVFSRSDAINDDSDFSGFELEVYNGANLLRTISTTNKTATYTQAQQTTDGGSTPYTIKLRQVATTGYTSDDAEFTINLV